MNKRTALLKQVTCESFQEKPTRPGEPFNSSKAHSSVARGQEITTSHPNNKILEHHVTKAANVLEIDPQQLLDWLSLYPSVSHAIQLSLLHLIARSKLDPFLEEVVFLQYESYQWEAAITVNGWSTLVNRSPVFSGVTFAQGPEDEQSIPGWMECSIYRSDRALPVTVREYFLEVKAQTPAWQKLPRRMLRHKVFSQCARLAFGLADLR